METDSLKDKLLKLNDYSIDTLTALACIQARNKIKINAYKGYCLLAIDGSEEPIDNTFYDKETTLLKREKYVILSLSHQCILLTIFWSILMSIVLEK